MRRMLLIFRVDGNVHDAVSRTLDRSPRQLLWARAASSIVARPSVEQSSTGRRSMSMTFKQPKLNFPAADSRNSNRHSHGARRHHYSAKVLPLVLFISADERSVLSRTGKSNCSKPSPTRR